MPNTYTIVIQPPAFYTLDYVGGGSQGPAGPPGSQGIQGIQGPAGSNASATTDASLLVSGTLNAARLPVNLNIGAGSGISLALSGTATIDTLVVQNAVNSSRVLNVKNLAGTEIFYVDAINRNVVAGGDAFAVRTATGGSYLFNNGFIGWVAGSAASTGTPTSTISQQSAGIVQIGTTAGNALGSIACLNGTFGVAGTSNGQITIGNSVSANAKITLGGTINSVLQGQNNTLGSTWQIVTDYSGSGGPACVRLGSTGSIGFGNAAANVGTIDTTIRRNAVNTLGVYTDELGSTFGSIVANKHYVYDINGNSSIGAYSNSGITIYNAAGGIGAIRTSSVNVESAGYVYWIARGLLSSSANGVIHVQNFDQNESVNQVLAFGPATTTTNGVRLKRIVGTATLNIRNGDDTAAGNLDCLAITAGDIQSNVNTYRIDNSNGSFRFWTDVWASRQATGVLQIGTNSSNALGSLACAQAILGAGTVSALPISFGASLVGFYSSGTDQLRFRTSTVVPLGFASYGMDVAVAGGYYGLGTTSPASGTSDVRWYRGSTGPTFDACAAGGFRSRDLANSADAPITASNVTASGTVTATDFAATPVTFAGLPPPSSKTGKSIQVSDRDYAIATSNGTNWLRAGTSTVLT